MLKDTSPRLALGRLKAGFDKLNGRDSALAHLAAGAVFSAVLLATTLTVTTSRKATHEMQVVAFDEGESENTNVRDALVEAWKSLNLKSAPEGDADTAEVAVQPEESAADVPPPVVYPFEEELAVKVKSGDTLAGILQQQKVGFDDTNAIIASLKKYYKPRSIRAGQEIELKVKRESADLAKLEKLRVRVDKLTHVEVTPKGEGFSSAKLEVETSKQLARAGGVITSSFYEAGDDAGIPSPILAELMKAYSYDVDFQRDVRPGQELEVLFEQLVADGSGEVVGHGDLKYASFNVKGKQLEVYKYTDRNGNTGYYKPNGESVRKALLKTPVNARISSRFGMRKHPILGYSKMHTGIDFAAGYGTPIYAAGDGVVNFSGRKGGYGNYVKIKHNATYETAYAHMSRFGKGIHNGSRVKQGQIIGYVGSTGRSTGPHLHYEILKLGKHINPSGVQFRTGNVLQGKELAAFKQEQSRLKNQLAALPRIRERVAQADIH